MVSLNGVIEGKAGLVWYRKEAEGKSRAEGCEALARGYHTG